ncbi:MAG TPA: Lrp/AsnC family transcriptional regulator [Verrucomicrobiota bacterium]|nr:Lrp/AsnC family transcriptional regulator [Verrucomicrobiota bacterium]
MLPAMDALLKLLRENAALSAGDLAGMLELSEDDVRDKIRQAQADGDILGYQAILSDESNGAGVQAVIEVKLTPERGGGFNRLADRISKYNEVKSCYLMSGSYDVLVIIDGNSLHEVASFVAEKLATIEGVTSTATHFLLKRYKENGVMIGGAEDVERLAVSP